MMLAFWQILMFSLRLRQGPDLLFPTTSTVFVDKMSPLMLGGTQLTHCSLADEPIL